MHLAKFPLALLLSLSAANVGQAQDSVKIAFGSCAHQDRSQAIWKLIAAKQPSAFLFIGDNVYADTTDEVKMRAAYAQLASNPEWMTFQTQVPVFATWDDHDYGANDAGAEYPAQAMSQKAFLDFFKVPTDSPRRLQKGVYSSEVIKSAGLTIQLILLDTRTFRSPLIKRQDRYVANSDPGATILGDTQWQWLEQRLAEPADLRILASSIQVLSDQHRFEKWGNFPLEKQKLFSLIRKTGAQNLVMISGDRHLGEISATSDSPVPYPLFDFTSSGLTEKLEDEIVRETNSLRLGQTQAHSTTNFGIIDLHRKAAEEPWKLSFNLLNGKGQELETFTIDLKSLESTKSSAPISTIQPHASQPETSSTR